MILFIRKCFMLFAKIVLIRRTTPNVFLLSFYFFIIFFFNLANESGELMAAGVSHEA